MLRLMKVEIWRWHYKFLRDVNDIPEQHKREASYSRPVTVPFAYER